MRRGIGICHLTLYDLGIFQVPLGVQSLEKLEKSFVFDLCLYLWLSLICLVRFYNLQGYDIKVFLYYFDRKIRDQVYFCFHLRIENNVLFSLRMLL